MSKSPSESESSVVSVSTEEVSVSVAKQPQKERSQDEPSGNQQPQNQDKKPQKSKSQPSTNQQPQSDPGSRQQSQSSGGACLPEFMQPRRQPSVSAAVKKASVILMDILFAVIVIYMVFLYLGFRFEELRVHQWFGVGEGTSTGHTINTIFAMLMAAIAREISQPVSNFAYRVFETVTHRVQWEKN